MKKFLAPILVIPLLLLQSCATTGPNIVQRYHQTYQTGTGQTFIHTGTDFSGYTGQPIVAPLDGIVLGVQDKKIRSGEAYFNIGALIQHANGLETDYQHLDSVLVKTGDKVIRGVTIIGTVGNTGYRNMKDKRPPKYPHLHFEVHKNGSNIDAEPFFVGCFDPSKTYGPEEMTYPTGCPTKK